MLTLQAGKTPIDALAFAPSGTGLVAIVGRKPHRWANVLAGGSPVAVPINKCFTVCFLPDDRALACCRDRLVLCDFETDRRQDLRLFPNGIGCSVAVAPNGQSFVLAFGDWPSNCLSVAARSVSDPGGDLWYRASGSWLGRDPMFLPDGKRFVICEFDVTQMQ